MSEPLKFGTGPGDDERQAKEDSEYWERQGFDLLGKICLFVLFPTMLIGLLLTAWHVAEKVK